MDLIVSKRQSVLSYITVCSLLGGVTVLSIKAVTSFIVLTFTVSLSLSLSHSLSLFLPPSLPPSLPSLPPSLPLPLLKP